MRIDVDPAEIVEAEGTATPFDTCLCRIAARKIPRAIGWMSHLHRLEFDARTRAGRDESA